MKTFKFIAAALFLVVLILVITTRRRERSEPRPLEPMASRPMENVMTNVPPPDRPRLNAAVRAKIIGITNFAALSAEQVRQFHSVVGPGVSNFVATLQKHGVSRFNTVALSASNFVSLHDPKPGNIWDLKIQSDDGRDYFVRFNQTQEMGIIAGLTNVVAFFPIRGRSVQGMMDNVSPTVLDPKSLVEIRARASTAQETAARNLSRAILTDLGNNVESFLEMPATTEQASGVKGGYMVAFRPKALDRPDNALYDTTFGYIETGSGLSLDTFTYNSARLLPPQRQQVPIVPIAAPRF